jgi:1-acyl-sn-glycerol-3-phosphate acyltransferase
MPDLVIKFNQILSYFFFYFPRRLFYNVDVSLPDNLKELKNGSLLVVNHQSILDPFDVLSCMPFGVFLKILPIRFPVTHKYMRKTLFSKVLPLLGCYDIGETAREKMGGLFFAHKLLKNGKTIFLFPEGKISKKGEISVFKKGIEFFTREAESVIFVRMDGFNKAKVPCFRKKCNMIFSPVNKLKNKKISAEELKLFFEKIK